MNIPNILTIFRLIAAPSVGLVFVIFAAPYADWIAISLFVGAALTDYLDGYLARKWGQVTNLGRMLDPIADKAIVLIALLVIAVRAPYIGLELLTPVLLITFREVFVSGLREFLGAKAGTLKVTWLAKWKTASQMLAITVLLASFLFGHYYWAFSSGMNDEILASVLRGETEDLYGLRWIVAGFDWSTVVGVWMLWIAAGLTVVTGIDYFIKALPVLKEV